MFLLITNAAILVITRSSALISLVCLDLFVTFAELPNILLTANRALFSRPFLFSSFDCTGASCSVFPWLWLWYISGDFPFRSTVVTSLALRHVGSTRFDDVLTSRRLPGTTTIGLRINPCALALRTQAYIHLAVRISSVGVHHLWTILSNHAITLDLRFCIYAFAFLLNKLHTNNYVWPGGSDNTYISTSFYAPLELNPCRQQTQTGFLLWCQFVPRGGQLIPAPHNIKGPDG